MTTYEEERGKEIVTQNTADYDADRADDELQNIVDAKAGLEIELKMIMSRCPKILMPESIAQIEEIFDDAFSDSWHKNREISGCIGWPINIPPFGALSFKTPVQKADEEYKRGAA